MKDVVYRDEWHLRADRHGLSDQAIRALHLQIKFRNGTPHRSAMFVLEDVTLFIELQKTIDQQRMMVVVVMMKCSRSLSGEDRSDSLLNCCTQSKWPHANSTFHLEDRRLRPEKRVTTISFPPAAFSFFPSLLSTSSLLSTPFPHHPTTAYHILHGFSSRRLPPPWPCQGTHTSIRVHVFCDPRSGHLATSRYILHHTPCSCSLAFGATQE